MYGLYLMEKQCNNAYDNVLIVKDKIIMFIHFIFIFHLFCFVVVESVKKISISNIPNDQNFELIMVDHLSDLKFYVGSIHHNWVLEEEQGPLNVFIGALKTKKDKCYALDVGMNDGFYTMLFASFTWLPCTFLRAADNMH